MLKTHRVVAIPEPLRQHLRMRADKLALCVHPCRRRANWGCRRYNRSTAVQQGLGTSRNAYAYDEGTLERWNVPHHGVCPATNSKQTKSHCSQLKKRAALRECRSVPAVNLFCHVTNMSMSKQRAHH